MFFAIFVQKKELTLQEVNKPTKGSIISHNKCLIDMKKPHIHCPISQMSIQEISTHIFFVWRLTQKVHKISHRNNWTAKLMKYSQSMKIIECLCLLLSMSMPEIFAETRKEAYWTTTKVIEMSAAKQSWVWVWGNDI